MSGIAAPGISVATIPALFFYLLAYFVIGRLRFYLTLIVRAKREQDEQRLIVRYECIGSFAAVCATATVVATVVEWPPLAWVFVAAALGALGLLLKRMLEEAISAEELNKIHAMEAVITSNLSLDDSFRRIERLAHRLVDWGDFRVYRVADGRLTLAYRSGIGWAMRRQPSADTATLRAAIVAAGKTEVIDDVPRDKRIADAREEGQSLGIAPLKFGGQAIGPLRAQHHKQAGY